MLKSDISAENEDERTHERDISHALWMILWKTLIRHIVTARLVIRVQPELYNKDKGGQKTLHLKHMKKFSSSTRNVLNLPVSSDKEVSFSLFMDDSSCDLINAETSTYVAQRHSIKPDQQQEDMIHVYIWDS
jgi:hypothetical protein